MEPYKIKFMPVEMKIIKKELHRRNVFHFDFIIRDEKRRISAQTNRTDVRDFFIDNYDFIFSYFKDYEIIRDIVRFVLNQREIEKLHKLN
jgi:hypothetical protein